MTVSVLGTEYDLLERNPEDDPNLKDADGYCDYSVGLCVVRTFDKREPDDVQDLERHKRKVKRHELIHAFLNEAGLRECCEWACEEMVDWLAMQFPKMAAAFEAAGCA